MDGGDPVALPLIRTKFVPLRLTRVPVRRESLMQLLESGRARALTSVRAPAGFGKTTALTMWRDELLGKKQRVAWLTLDRDDNDEQRFFGYLAETLAQALGVIGEDWQDISHSPKPVSIVARLTALINAVDTFGIEVTLILDDYEKISAPPVNALLEFLLTHIPRNLHVVIAGRIDPQFPLSALRARDQLVEIDADALRFEIEDTQAFFATSVAIKLTADQTRTIHDITEGWVVGLQIAALVVPRSDGSKNLFYPLPRHARALDEYLAENVLAQTDPEMVAFMLRTSVLGRLSGELCQSLTGFPDAKERLEWLVKQNMFLQPLDDEGHWYRYHGLFADFLRTQLRRAGGDEIRALHLRAAQWFSANSLWSEAVRHAIDADGMALAIQCLEQCSLDELKASRVRDLLDLIRQLPSEAVRQQPRLRVAFIWALVLTVHIAEAMALIDDVEAQLDQGDFTDAAELRPVLRVQRVAVLSMTDEAEAALALCEQVWAERFPEGRRPSGGFDWVDAVFLNVQIHVYRINGRLVEARNIAEFFRPTPDPRDNLFMMSHRACQLAALDIHEGSLRVGARRLEDMLVLCEAHAGRRSAAASLVAAWLARVYYAWNRLDEVDALLANRLDVIDDVCPIDAAQAAYLSLVKLRVVQGAVDAAHALLDRAELLAEKRGWPRLQATCTAERFRIWCLEDRPADAARTLKTLENIVARATVSGQGGHEISTLLQITSARHQIQFGQPAAAVDALLIAIQAWKAQRGADMPCNVLRLRVLLALAQAASDDVDAATASMATVLTVAEREAVLRMIVDEGPGVVPLVNACLSRQEPPLADSYVSQLCQALGNENALPLPQGQSPSAEGFDSAAFSRRELEILELVLQKCSNKQIASTLFITAETVKWHLKNLYRKLGVSDRRLVAQKMRDLGKIQDLES